MKKAEYSDLSLFFEGISLTNDNFIFDSSDFSDKKRLSDPIFKSIGYPSKIFYENIQRYIRSYTREGGMVLDSCAGSGSAGIAALLEGRKAILVDNSPLAINMEYNLINYVDIKKLNSEYHKLIKVLSQPISDLYKTLFSNGTVGYADVIIASNVYTCPSCGNEIILYKNETGKRSEYRCQHCSEIINISNKETKTLMVAKRKPVEVTIKSETGRKEVRPITPEDVILWDSQHEIYQEKYGHYWSPSEKIIYNRCYPRVGGWPGFAIDASVSDLFPRKNLLALKMLNHYIETEIVNEDLQCFMKFVFLETLFRTSSRLFTESGIKNVYHIPPVGKEQNVLTVFKRKYRDITKAKIFLQDRLGSQHTKTDIKILKGDAKHLPIPSDCVDYAFIDPPYGGMVPYAELNLFYSAWLHEKEDLDEEIIIPMDYEKKAGYVEKWGSYIEEAFGEVFRVLRPGAHFTVAFHSTFNNIWNELKDIMLNRLGFEFVNIVENERGTTFHTNHINDTNPISAFITYMKPFSGNAANHTDHIASVFDYISDAEFWSESKTFRDIQSRIIIIVHNKNLEAVPDDKDIYAWIHQHCIEEQGRYRLIK